MSFGEEMVEVFADSSNQEAKLVPIHFRSGNIKEEDTR